MTRTDTAEPGTVSLLPILSVHFVGTLGFSIVLPFLVFLVTRWGGNALIYGVIGATYSVFQMVGAPILGRWSDRLGRRRILLLSQAGTLVSWLILLLAFTLPTNTLVHVDSPALGSFTITLPLIIVFLARAADGLTGGNISVATAYLADISREQDRSANFGKLSVSSNLGFVLGPAIAGFLGATAMGEVLPVVAAAVISLGATLLILFGLPESSPCMMRRDPEQKDLRRIFGKEHVPCYTVQGSGKLSGRQILALPGIPVILAAYFLVMLGFNFFYVSFPVQAVTGLAWSVADTGMFFAILSAMMALVQGPLLAWVSRRSSDAALVSWGSLMLGASFLCFVSHDARLVYAGAGLMALGNGVLWPSIVSILAQRAGERHQGAVQGYASSLGAAASILGLVVGGVLFDVIGSGVFAISAVMIFFVFALGIGMRVPPRSAPEPA